MLRKTLNLGILAHVDAGKTTLTERLLYTAGVIDEIGSVDAGTTQTDSLALEQQRGITIKSAVVSFAIGDVTVNLIDTPGHPDFIAEVERVLHVLDGVVLVVSGVEGVQAQTRVLMRALERLRIPTLFFVNKLDRRGADPARVLQEIKAKLTTAAIAATDVTDHVDLLAEHDEELLAAYVDDEAKIASGRILASFAEQTRRARVHPVFFGSAMTGAGVDELMNGIATLLPATVGDADAPLSATVFKIDGSDVLVRLFTGTIHVRDRVDDAKVTAIHVFDGATPVQVDEVTAGEIAKLSGLTDMQIGDSLGAPSPRAPARGAFAPPTLEAVVAPRDAEEKPALYVALGQLAEQDPLINVRRDDERHELWVSLYGEVQKEVIEATLANDFGIAVEFRETTTIHVERPVGSGEALEVLHAETNPFHATVGVRIDRAQDGSGIEFRVRSDPRTVPLYLYKTMDGFTERMREYVRETLGEGLFGWQVTDCVVTLTRCEYSIADGPPSRRGPTSTAADFRKLTPIVVMEALNRAGTVVCEPTVRARVEMPMDTTGAVMAALARLGASVEPPTVQGELSTIEAVLPAARADDLQRELSGLTRGEGVLETAFGGYQPVSGESPIRRRTTPNPLNLSEYMMYLAKRA